jgi:small subunit ribosomal protein S10
MKKRYQIRLKSLHKDSLNLYKNFLSKTLQSIKINFSICNLPKKKNRITLLKSPHVNKKSREQFHLKNYNQKIDIYLKNVFPKLNFLIILKKIVNINYLIKIKIIKQ